MKHEDVLETVDAQFQEGWRKAKGAHLALSINPLTGLENTIETLFEEMGWDRIDHDVLMPFVLDPAKFEELESHRAAGDFPPDESLMLNRMQNRALGQYGKAVFDEIKQRHGL